MIRIRHSVHQKCPIGKRHFSTLMSAISRTTTFFGDSAWTMVKLRLFCNFLKIIKLFYFSGSESPAPFVNETKDRKLEGERIRQMAKRLIGPEALEKHLSNEISAPYEVPQYPIEQIETKLIR